jgi:L-amino acid N-acyltransferase
LILFPPPFLSSSEKKLRSLGYPILVAVLNSEVIGYGSFGPFSSSIHDTFTNHGFRHTVELTVHIDQNHRRKGIGRALVQALIDEAKKRPNIHVLVAGIAAVNTASISLFELFGFEIVAKMPETGLKYGKWLDDVLMQKIL